MEGPQGEGQPHRALEAADTEWAGKKVDLSVLEKLLADLPANQLVSVHDQATGEAGRSVPSLRDSVSFSRRFTAPFGALHFLRAGLRAGVVP